jgi:hypothetical protein
MSDIDNDAWTAAGCNDLFPADEHANEQIAKNNAWIAEKERQAEEWAKDFNKAEEELEDDLSDLKDIVDLFAATKPLRRLKPFLNWVADKDEE